MKNETGPIENPQASSGPGPPLALRVHWFRPTHSLPPPIPHARTPTLSRAAHLALPTPVTSLAVGTAGYSSCQKAPFLGVETNSGP